MNPLRLGGWFRCVISVVWVLFTAGFSTTAPAQDLSLNEAPARSISGQFIVTAQPGQSPLLTLPQVVTNASFVRLNPALLAVSAERIKKSLYRLLAVPSVRDWQGKIYLDLHPALWADETVTVIARPTDRDWSYLVQLPNVVLQARFIRAMTEVLLLEMANRQGNTDGLSADVPAWLIDGMAGHLQQDELADVVLSSPEHVFDAPRAQSVLPGGHHDLDPLAEARSVLHQHPALTFDQLSWPTPEQQAGQDDGVFHASAQLFVTELLKLNDGPVRLQRMLAALPECYNWQTAFQNAFRERFPRQLDLEKWWALQVITFLAQDPGPAWTPAASAVRLDELLVVPVQVRQSPDALPGHTFISLQAAIHYLAPAQVAADFQTRLRDLRVAEPRMAPGLQGLTESYCKVLAGYLGEQTAPTSRPAAVKHPVHLDSTGPGGEVSKQLDELDIRRQALEAGLK